jgi:hypothetical protein
MPHAPVGAKKGAKKLLWNHSYKESYRLCKNYYETEEEARAQKRAVEPLMNE